MPRRTWFLLAGLATAATLLYATRLGYVPAHLMHDEAQFALQAASIASTGHDLAGRFLPVFFTEPEFPAGRDPASIYLTAVALVWLPVSEASVRLPTALLGVASIVLMFLLARRLFVRDSMALIAAMFLALTPAYFIRSRLLLSPQGSVPIIIAWLLCLAAFSDRPATRRMSLAGAWLGIGLYTYLACVVMMPVYLLLTMIVGARTLGPRAAVTAAAAFAVATIPMAVWYVTHPERFAQVVGAYELASTVQSTAPPVSTALAALRTKVGLDRSFFSPEYLFVSGDASLINSTRMAGLFPLSFAILIPAGVLQLVTARRDMGFVIIAGLISAPLAAVVSGAIEMNRILFVMPFGVLTAIYGVEWLATARSRLGLVAAFVLVAAVPVQFAGFYQDYMGRYRIRSGSWLGGNTSEAMTAAIERQAAGASDPVYVSRAILHASRYWRFYALAAGRADVIDRAVFYDADMPVDAPPGAELLCRLESMACRRLQEPMSGWTQLRAISDLDGTVSLALFEKR